MTGKVVGNQVGNRSVSKLSARAVSAKAVVPTPSKKKAVKSSVKVAPPRRKHDVEGSPKARAAASPRSGRVPLTPSRQGGERGKQQKPADKFFGPEAIKKALALGDWGETSQAELLKLIASSKGTVTMKVTPTIAAFFLLKNTGNRRLRNTRVFEMATLIQENRYQNTGEPIIMSDEAILNNGQHRLSGVVAAGMPVEMDIRFGIPRKAFQVTDTHSKRLAGDVLADRGDVSVFAVAAAARLLVAYERGLPGSYWQKVQNDQIADFVDRVPDLHEAVHVAQRFLKGRKGFYNASSNAFTLLALRQCGSEEQVGQFLGIVESGVTASANDPARQLRERLLRDEQLRRGGREVIVERFALFVKAWNSWLEGDKVTRLSWKGPGERGAEPFPVIQGADLKRRAKK